MRLVVAADAEAAAARAAVAIATAAAAAIAARGTCSLALSGGRTPGGLFERLAAASIAWERVRLFQVDERIAPADDPARNLARLRTGLLDRLAVGPELLAMPVEADDAEAAAARYATALPAALDVVHLGLGDDGHTASLVPGDPVLAARAPVAVTGFYRGHRRMTLTYPALAAAGQLVYLVTGAGKRHAVAGLLAGDPDLPAGRVARGRALVVADRDAADGVPPAGQPAPSAAGAR
jgi:6-phosphogluconolactonase